MKKNWIRDLVKKLRFDKKCKDTIFGYIRQFEEEHQCTIPLLIHYHCLMYFGSSNDYFVKSGKLLRIDNTDCKYMNKVTTCLADPLTSMMNTAYGNYTINTDNTNISKYIWTLEHSMRGGELSIGICSSNRQWINYAFTKSWKCHKATPFYKFTPFYGFTFTGNGFIDGWRYEQERMDKLGREFSEDHQGYDQMKLIVDAESNKLSIVCNKYGTILTMNDIKLSGFEWNLAVSIVRADKIFRMIDFETVEMINFETVKRN